MITNATPDSSSTAAPATTRISERELCGSDSLLAVVAVVAVVAVFVSDEPSVRLPSAPLLPRLPAAAAHAGAAASASSAATHSAQTLVGRLRDLRRARLDTSRAYSLGDRARKSDPRRVDLPRASLATA